MKIIHNRAGLKLTKGKQVYECNTCGELFNWDNESSWYGSYKQMEEQPNKIKYFCSDKCVQNRFKKPKEGRKK